MRNKISNVDDYVASLKKFYGFVHKIGSSHKAEISLYLHPKDFSIFFNFLSKYVKGECNIHAFFQSAYLFYNAVTEIS